MYKVSEASSLERSGPFRKWKDAKKKGKDRSVQPKGQHTSSKQTNQSPRKTVIKNESSRRCKTKEDSDKCYIKPNVTSSTMSLTFPTEVRRLVSYANGIWVSLLLLVFYLIGIDLIYVKYHEIQDS